MAANDRVAKVIVKYEVDKPSVAGMSASIDQIQRALTKVKGGSSLQNDLQKNLSKLQKELSRKSGIDDLAKGFANLAKQTGEYEDNLISLRKALREVGASSKEIALASASFQDLTAVGGTGGGRGLNLRSAESLTQRGSRALRGLGLPGGQELGDISDALQLFNSAKEGLAGVSTQAGAVAGQSTAAAGGFAALSAGLAPMLPILIPLAGAVIAAGVAFKVIHDEFERGKELVQTYIDEQDKELSQRQKNIETLKSTTAAELKIRADTLQEQKAFGQQEIDERKNQIQELLKQGLASKDLLEQGAILQTVGQLQENLKKLEAGQKDLNDEYENTVNTLIPARTAIEAFNLAAAEMADHLKRQKELYDNLNSIREKADAKERADQLAFDNKRIAEAVSATKKFNDATAKAAEDGEQDIVDIRQKYLDKVADITQAQLDAAESALQKLQDREADLLSDSQRDDDKEARKQALDDVQVQIKARREERDDLVAHLRKVRDIQRSFLSAERDALFDRNFLELFKLQENKKEQLQVEDANYQEQAADREQAFKDQQADTARQRGFERNERRIALQNALTDARNGYQRELELAIQKRDRALQIAAQERDYSIMLAQNKAVNVLTILAAQYSEEIRLANMSAQARLDIEKALLAQAQSAGFTLPSSSSGLPPGYTYVPDGSGDVIRDDRIYTRASGGSLARGDVSMVNDRFPGQREAFNGRMFPPGLGVFQAAQAGYVSNKGGAGATLVQNNTYPSGLNERQISSMVERNTRKLLSDYLGDN